MAVLEKNWYVVRAVSGQENKVKNYIESEISRLGYGDYVEQVDKVNEEKRKLEVIVKIFGRKTPLELSYTQVEKI